ncbi:Hypothetical predicted protein [Olea europaea subsp. europaea]|uniref:Uncharacterized protein n=1 Tax=Olea europaea subsp. europaea TaxID=158383 RepID=A0A8S0U7R4_OLEEU|nr:Hypothetical predicted protein [Olea europaea subsp. europaea]
MLSWSSNQHVKSVELRKTIFYLIKLEGSQIVPLEAENGEEYTVGLFVEGLGGDQDDDNFEHPVVRLKKLMDERKIKSVDRARRSTEKKNKGKIDEVLDLEVRIQSNPIENRLKDVEKMAKTNEEVMERLQILERKVENMLTGNEEQMKDGVESLPNETDQVLAGNEKQMKDGVERLPDETDHMLAGIEFELSCGEKDVEHVASPFNKDKIELLEEEVELKDDVWEKVVEVTAAIEVEAKIEEGNIEITDIDDVTPNMHLKRQKKPGVLFQFP